jgi:hypothetical protein
MTQVNDIEGVRELCRVERFSALPSTMVAARLTAVDRGDNVPCYP